MSQIYIFLHLSHRWLLAQLQRSNTYDENSASLKTALSWRAYTYNSLLLCFMLVTHMYETNSVNNQMNFNYSSAYGYKDRHLPTRLLIIARSLQLISYC